ncbi:MAG: Protein YciI [Pseudomonas sp.]|nr:MAG: Protein YciI [Pseudomonas sp.]
MIYSIHCLYKTDITEQRAQLLPIHRDYIKVIADRVAFAGPLLGREGEPLGSLIVADFDDEAQAHAWITREPFNSNGLFRSVEVLAFQNRWPQKAGFPVA